MHVENDVNFRRPDGASKFRVFDCPGRPNHISKLSSGSRQGCSPSTFVCGGSHYSHHLAATLSRCSQCPRAGCLFADQQDSRGVTTRPSLHVEIDLRKFQILADPVNLTPECSSTGS